jgi:hypothetical protein
MSPEGLELEDEPEQPQINDPTNENTTKATFSEFCERMSYPPEEC